MFPVSAGPANVVQALCVRSSTLTRRTAATPRPRRADRPDHHCPRRRRFPPSTMIRNMRGTTAAVPPARSAFVQVSREDRSPTEAASGAVCVVSNPTMGTTGGTKIEHTLESTGFRLASLTCTFAMGSRFAPDRLPVGHRPRIGAARATASLGRAVPATEDTDRIQVEQAKESEPRSCRNQHIRPNRRSQYPLSLLRRYSSQHRTAARIGS